jgi:GNAT superfamily N-acetyltransferase
MISPAASMSIGGSDVPKPDHLLLDNIAVNPSHQHLGFGRQLLEFAEAEALRQGCGEIRLYTQQAPGFRQSYRLR